jgi:hypothetical protein
MNEGLKALVELAWPTVLQTETHARFARALLGDIADAIGMSQTAFPGTAHPLTARRSNGLLRNVD